MNDTGNKKRAVESECGPFHLSQLRGAQSIVFTKAPYLLSAASVAGSKEAQGPLGKYFDLTNEDDLFGAETWEEAESNMQKEACVASLVIWLAFIAGRSLSLVLREQRSRLAITLE